MLTVWLILIIMGLTLTVLLWVGTLFLQSYIYTEPTPGIAWQAPAAGAALALLYALWCILIINKGGTPSNIPYDTLFNFSAKVDLSPKPLPRLTAVRDNGAKVEYVRKYDKFGKPFYQDNTIAPKPWQRAGVKAIHVEYGGRTYYFQLVEETGRGQYREFVDKDGWVMIEFEGGPNGVATAFDLGRFLINMFLNFFHVSLWFMSLWLLLRFQWSHALGLAFVMWVLMSLAVLPMLFEQAARTNVAATSSALARGSRLLTVRL